MKNIIPTEENTAVEGMADFFFSQFYQWCHLNKKKFCVWHGKCYEVVFNGKKSLKENLDKVREYHGPAEHHKELNPKEPKTKSQVSKELAAQTGIPLVELTLPIQKTVLTNLEKKFNEIVGDGHPSDLHLADLTDDKLFVLLAMEMTMDGLPKDLVEEILKGNQPPVNTRALTIQTLCRVFSYQS